jgi:hypothetical protein
LWFHGIDSVLVVDGKVVGADYVKKAHQPGWPMGLEMWMCVGYFRQTVTVSGNSSDDCQHESGVQSAGSDPREVEVHLGVWVVGAPVDQHLRAERD